MLVGNRSTSYLPRWVHVSPPTVVTLLRVLADRFAVGLRPSYTPCVAQWCRLNSPLTELRRTVLVAGIRHTMANADWVRRAAKFRWPGTIRFHGRPRYFAR